MTSELLKAFRSELLVGSTKAYLVMAEARAANIGFKVNTVFPVKRYPVTTTATKV